MRNAWNEGFQQFFMLRAKIHFTAVKDLFNHFLTEL